MEPIYIYRTTDIRPELHLVKGNSKIGKTIWSFSTLPGDRNHQLRLKDGRFLIDTYGTCAEKCDYCFDAGCYAVNSARQYYTSVIPAWTANTLLKRRGELFTALRCWFAAQNKPGEPPKVTLFRINVSGEIESAEELREWNRLAAEHPETKFGLYTKNYEALEEFLNDPDTPRAANFAINVSQWHGCADDFLAAHPQACNVFEYDDSLRKGCTLSDDDRTRLAGLPHCPAVLASGKHAKTAAGDSITCDMCLRCYRNTGRTTAVYAH